MDRRWAEARLADEATKAIADANCSDYSKCLGDSQPVQTGNDSFIANPLTLGLLENPMANTAENLPSLES